jgi:DNA helicase-2/ATP-dependent DNA helicase PcrA
VKTQLEAVPGDYFDAILHILDVRFPGMDDSRLRQALAEAYCPATGYDGIVDITRQHLQMERLLDTGSRRSSLTLMTIHKCKGKEFDAVVVAEGTGPQDVWIRRDEQVGDEKPNSRRLLHVAITRAKQRVVLITPAFRKSGLLP